MKAKQTDLFEDLTKMVDEIFKGSKESQVRQLRQMTEILNKGSNDIRKKMKRDQEIQNSATTADHYYRQNCLG